MHVLKYIVLCSFLLLTGCDVGGGGVFAIGQSVPPLKTKTLADVGGDMSKITSYRYPDPRMYQFSFDDALKTGKPIIMEFATPGHCTQCDKQLQMLKVVMDEYEDRVIFLHMDQYYNPEAYDAFQVRGEPWTFVIDGQGKVNYVAPGRMLYSEMMPVLARLFGDEDGG
ncbi:thioredoxin family protein [Mariprofundus ferrooxydans]|nr:thioredoxin family protein [Mariprofundus ferrooxydans]